MTYVPPKQMRALETQERFLNAMEQLLQTQSYSATTIDEIASLAGLGRGAFLSRFGSKRGALEVLWARYAEACIQRADYLLKRGIKQQSNLLMAMSRVIKDAEYMQAMHIGANRAMAEVFQETLKSHPLTIEVFLKISEVMRACQAQFLRNDMCTEDGANYAAQLVVTLSFQYNMRGMPAMPRDATRRHDLIGKMLAVAIEQ